MLRSNRKLVKKTFSRSSSEGRESIRIESHPYAETPATFFASQSFKPTASPLRGQDRPPRGHFAILPLSFSPIQRGTLETVLLAVENFDTSQNSGMLTGMLYSRLGCE